MSDKIEEIRERNLLKRISQKEPEIAIRELYYDLVTLAHLAERQFDKIQQLRADNERLCGALENIVGHWNHTHDDALKRWEGSSTRAFEDLEYVEAAAIKPLVDIARAALEGKP